MWTGRELAWGCLMAAGVPLMKLLGINESLIGSSTAFSAAISIVLSITVAYISG